MNPTRTRFGKFKRAYTRKHLLEYIKGVSKLIRRSPTYRDLTKFPGPTPSTIIRHFNKWSIAIKKSGLRPLTHQLVRGEKSYIRHNWRLMTDRQISSKLNIPVYVIRYYRLSQKLWKNTRNKMLTKATQKRIAQNIYGKNCEVCNVPITELHHLVSRSKFQDDWAMLCPLCHEIVTRKLIIIKKRADLFSKLRPFVKAVYSNLNSHVRP